MSQSMTDSDWLLYSTEACHLCDLAKELVIPLASERQCSLTIVDVSNTDELMARYGVHIPVLHRTSDGAELPWPFNSASLLKFLSQ